MMSIYVRAKNTIHDSSARCERGHSRRLLFAATALASLGLACSSSSGNGSTGQVTGGSGGSGQAAGGAGMGGVAASGGSNGTGGSTAAGGSVATGGSTAKGGTTTTAGTVSAGGSVSTGGVAVTAGGSSASGGSTPRGGTTTAGTVSAGGSTPRGGTTATAGTVSTGGSVPVAGSTGTGVCPMVGQPPTPDTATRAKCTSTSTGIACHFGGNPGNYDVSFNLGGTSAGQTQVQAETWREMLAAPVAAVGDAVASIATTAGQKLPYSMTVNVRDPEGQPDWTVSAGTPGLDMYFIGSSPQLDSIAYAPAAASEPVLYILTDSTGCDQPGSGTPGNTSTAGWGQWLPQFFNYGISVANYGNSGGLTECSAATVACPSPATNYRSFYDDPKMWPAIKPLLKAGDVVLIEFAHNDKVSPQAVFEANLLKYITETKAAGAIPILATPIPRCNFTGNTMNSSQIVNSLQVDLPASIRSVGAANNIPVIEITKTAVAFFSTVGASSCSKYWADGVTHMNTVGANVVATMIRDQIKSLNIYPLVCYLR